MSTEEDDPEGEAEDEDEDEGEDEGGEEDEARRLQPPSKGDWVRVETAIKEGVSTIALLPFLLPFLLPVLPPVLALSTHTTHIHSANSPPLPFLFPSLPPSLPPCP